MEHSAVSALLALIILTSCLVTLYLSAYAYHRKGAAGAKELSFFLLTVVLYSLGVAFEINSGTLPQILIFIKFQFIWAGFTGPTFLLFVMRYLSGKKIPFFVYSLTLAIPIILGILALNLENHQLIYRNFWIAEGKYFPTFFFQSGPLHLGQVLFLIATSLAGEVLLLFHALRSRGKLRMQCLLIFAGSLLPTIHAIIFPERTAIGLDTQPFAFILMGVLIYVSFFRYDMLSLIRIAREEAVDSISDYMIVFDLNRTVLDINRAGRDSELLNKLEINRKLETGTLPLALNRFFEEYLGDDRNNRFEFTSGDRHYTIKINTIIHAESSQAGYSVLIHDISETVNLMEELEKQATIDQLTGILNRRQWLYLVKREISLLNRTGGSFVFMMMDLDNFKKINDTNGHLAGDRALVEVTSSITRTLRQYDIFGRYGGEEFCAFCINTDREMGMLIAERVRENIEKIELEAQNSTITMTISIGLFHSSQGNADEIEHYLHKADTALYEAKKQGRNRCVYYS